MKSDFEPIIFNAPREAKEIVLHFLHDPHYGNPQFDAKRWERVIKEVQKDGHYAFVLGDMCENVSEGTKGDILYQVVPPDLQREWCIEQFRRIGPEKVLAVVPGNHERRSTKKTGWFMLRDACLLADPSGELEKRYRQHFALVDLGVGIRLRSSSTSKAQNRYIVFGVHKAKEMKNFSSADFVDGCDVFAFGHDHDAKSHPRASIRYDTTRKSMSIGVTRVVNCGSNMIYGGYAADEGYRPNALVEYKVHFSGTEKETWVEER